MPELCAGIRGKLYGFIDTFVFFSPDLNCEVKLFQCNCSIGLLLAAGWRLCNILLKNVLAVLSLWKIKSCMFRSTGSQAYC